jgi:hypothetical protein
MPIALVNPFLLTVKARGGCRLAAQALFGLAPIRKYLVLITNPQYSKLYRVDIDNHPDLDRCTE